MRLPECFRLFHRNKSRLGVSARAKKTSRTQLTLETLEERTVPAAVTWQVQSDYFGTQDTVSEPRSLRGLTLTADALHVYGGFIQGTTSAAIREVSSGVNASLIGNDGGSPTNSYGTNPPYTTGLEAKVTTFFQAKGLATDDRGNVYATLSNGTNSTTQQWAIYNGALTSQVALVTSTDFIAARTLPGMATAKIGGNYYAYIGWQNGQIERWNVNNPAVPVLDTTWGSALHPGTISLKTINANAYLNNLTVDADGTIYVASGLQGTTSFGDSLIKIPAAAAASGDLTSYSHADVMGGANGTGGFSAMDVALFAGQAYVTEYLQTNSTIAVFNLSDLSSAGIITPTDSTGPSGLNATFPTGTDSGISDIDISPDGKIYVVEQLYNMVPSTGSYTPPGGVSMTGTRIYFDRIMVSSALGQSPAIISADHATFTVNANNSFTVMATGTPTPSLSITATLPANVTFVDNHDGTATLSGVPVPGTNGDYTFTITASNSTGPDFTQQFTLTVISPPVLPVLDQFLGEGQLPFNLTLPATTAQGAALSYTATAADQVAFSLDQTLQLQVDPAGLFTNSYADEKWLRGVPNTFGNPWYFLLPDGEFDAWSGQAHSLTGTLLGTLTPNYYANPALLYNAPAPFGTVAVAGNQLTIGTTSATTGSFEIVVDGTAGAFNVSTHFRVTVSAANPTVIDSTPVSGNLGFIEHQVHSLTMDPAGDYLNYGGQQSRWLKGAANQFGNVWYFIKPNGEFWAWDGTANLATGALLQTLEPIFYQHLDLLTNPTQGNLTPGGQPQDIAYVLDQYLNLHSNGDFQESWNGQGVKWLMGNTNQFGNNWYFVKSTGEVWAWNGSATAAGSLLAALDPDYFTNITRLFNAQPNQYSVSFVNGQLDVDWLPAYHGTFGLLVTITGDPGTVNDVMTATI